MSTSAQPPRIRVIACATVVEELRPLLPAHAACQVFDSGLHVNPSSLQQALQGAINSLPHTVETVVLGYGLCSQAVVDLRSDTATLVVPRVDDCIGLFLGSDEAYRDEVSSTPGTYYLTKGWVEAGSGPFADYDQLVERYGEERAAWLMGKMLERYTRLALINTHQYELARYRAYARETAERFELRYEEIEGSTLLLKKLAQGPWDDDFVVVPPGRPIMFCHFRETVRASSAPTVTLCD